MSRLGCIWCPLLQASWEAQSALVQDLARCSSIPWCRLGQHAKPCAERREIMGGVVLVSVSIPLPFPYGYVRPLKGSRRAFNHSCSPAQMETPPSAVSVLSTCTPFLQILRLLGVISGMAERGWLSSCHHRPCGCLFCA